MKRIIYFFTCFLLSIAVEAQIYSLSSGDVSFYSSTILEDIEATSNEVAGLMDLESQEYYFEVRIKSFEFDKALMKEHFNENYMESDKYPKAEFSGKFKGDVDFSKPGTYRATLVGVLNVHGVEKEREIDLNIDVKEEGIFIRSEFRVELKDHKIKIPKIVFKNIAEVIDVKVSSKLEPYKE